MFFDLMVAISFDSVRESKTIFEEFARGHGKGRNRSGAMQGMPDLCVCMSQEDHVSRKELQSKRVRASDSSGWRTMYRMRPLC